MARPAKYVASRTGLPGNKDANGSLVTGLSRHPNGSYYATFTGPKCGTKRVYFGKIGPQALVRYREWEAIKTGKILTLEDTERAADHALPLINKVEIEYLGDLPKDALAKATDAALGTRWNIPKQVFWAMFRRMMQDDIRGCAEASGDPLDRLHLYRAPERPLAVAEVLAPFEKPGVSLLCEAATVHLDGENHVPDLPVVSRPN